MKPDGRGTVSCSEVAAFIFGDAHKEFVEAASPRPRRASPDFKAASPHSLRASPSPRASGLAQGETGMHYGNKQSTDIEGAGQRGGGGSGGEGVIRGARRRTAWGPADGGDNTGGGVDANGTRGASGSGWDAVVGRIAAESTHKQPHGAVASSAKGAPVRKRAVFSINQRSGRGGAVQESPSSSEDESGGQPFLDSSHLAHMMLRFSEQAAVSRKSPPLR